MPNCVTPPPVKLAWAAVALCVLVLVLVLASAIPVPVTPNTSAPAAATPTALARDARDHAATLNRVMVVLPNSAGENIAGLLTLGIYRSLFVK
jgi:hypothetical protein